MASELVPMSRVTSCMAAWTALVHVIEADRCRAVEHSEVFSRFRRFQFGDSQGIVVSAVVFDDAIALVDGLLLPFRKYYVSNAEVREVPQGVQPGFYWVITRDTVIREALDVGEPILPFYFHLRSYDSLHFVAETNKFISLLSLFISFLFLFYMYVLWLDN